LLSAAIHLFDDAYEVATGPLKVIISPICTVSGLDGRMNMFTNTGMISLAFSTPFSITYNVSCA